MHRCKTLKSPSGQGKWCCRMGFSHQTPFSCIWEDTQVQQHLNCSVRSRMSDIRPSSNGFERMENTNSPDTAEGKADAVYRKQPQRDVDRLQARQDVLCTCTGQSICPALKSSHQASQTRLPLSGVLLPPEGRSHWGDLNLRLSDKNCLLSS